MDWLVRLTASGLFSLIVAYITAAFKIRAALKEERRKRVLDVVMQQRYKYLLPFKSCANEFRGRLKHLTKRLSEKGEKHENMVKRFRQDFTDKKMEWFFSDRIGQEGGYYITSTVHMNCMLFYWIKRLQYEYPYIPLTIPKSEREGLDKYNGWAQEERFLSPIGPQCDIHTLIKHIKIIIGGQHGIPYGLHNSFGDFMYCHSEKRLLNYDEFCRQLTDASARIKFGPLLNFWSSLVDDKGHTLPAKMRKFDMLMMILGLLESAEIRE